MNLVFGSQAMITSVVQLVLAVLAIGAFVNSLLYSSRSYEAAGKLTKPTWCIILALAVLIEVGPLLYSFSGGFFLSIAAIVASLVYILDVRPALAGLYRR